MEMFLSKISQEEWKFRVKKKEVNIEEIGKDKKGISVV